MHKELAVSAPGCTTHAWIDCRLVVTVFVFVNGVLQLWESFLHGRRFLVGESVTLADVAFFPNLAYNIRLGMNVMSVELAARFVGRCTHLLPPTGVIPI